jgi:FkbM family methyltransferase
VITNASRVFERLPRFLRRHRLMTAWMRLTGEDPLQLVRIRDESYGYADMRDGFLRLIVIEGDFESEFFRIADHFLEAGGVFVDVGANHGLLSLGLAGKHADSVAFHLFEPNAELRESIRKSLSMYPPLDVRVNAEALSSSAGEVRMHFESGHLGMSHVVDSGGVSVDSTTLDSYLDSQDIGFVDLLKIDVEGFELEVLRGCEQAMQQNRIGAVYFEYCEKWLRRNHEPRELLLYLDSLQYEVCFCRTIDLAMHGNKKRTVLTNALGSRLELVPISGLSVPETTDILAVPRSLLEKSR